MNKPIEFAVILIVSAALSAGYAVVLARRPEWYRYNGRTWATVVIGAIFIFASLGMCVAIGEFRLMDLGIAILVTSAWGAPILYWQIAQSGAEREHAESIKRLTETIVHSDDEREVGVHYDKNPRW